MSDEKPMGQVIEIDEARIRDHLGEMVRGQSRKRSMRCSAQGPTCLVRISRCAQLD